MYNRTSSTEYVNTVIIGSGAAGCMVAKTMIENSVNTLMLEAGPVRGAIEHEKTVGFHSSINRLSSIIHGQRVQARSTSFKKGNKHFFVNDREHPYTVAHDQPFKWIRGRQFGGRMHTWGRMAPRFSNSEFKAASVDGIGFDWPVDEEEMSPYYSQVERLFGLKGNLDALDYLPDGEVNSRYPLTNLEVGFQDRIKSKYENLDVISARVLGNFNDIFQSTPSSDTLRFQANSPVFRISVNPNDGYATGVEYIDSISGVTHAVKCHKIFLCASAFETIRILLNSANARHPDGIGNSTGNLGRGIMDHLFVFNSGQIPKNIMEIDEQITSNADFIMNEDTLMDTEQGFYIPRCTSIQNKETTRSFAIQGAIGRGGPWWWLGAFGEVLPNRNNRLTLDKKRRDTHGIPVLKINFSHASEDKKLLLEMQLMLKKLLKQSGIGAGKRYLQDIHFFGSQSFSNPAVLYPGLSVHEAGGARFGSDRENCVTDPQCRIWDSPNIIVCDGALFPSVGYQNPALTIMALSLRASQLNL